MPNWASNNIDITGPADKIKTLWEEANQEGNGLLNAMAPIGEWEYGTAVDTWGTKWDVGTEGLEFTDNGDGTASITGYFDSAWSPPIGAYESFMEANEDCEISASYYECGMDFAGFWHGYEEHLENLRDEYDAGDDASELYKRLDQEWNLSEQYDEEDQMAD